MGTKSPNTERSTGEETTVMGDLDEMLDRVDSQNDKKRLEEQVGMDVKVETGEKSDLSITVKHGGPDEWVKLGQDVLDDRDVEEIAERVDVLIERGER